jgi:hypothetical protein
MISQQLINLVSRAKQAEDSKDISTRNHIAQEIFRNRKNRVISHLGYQLETWYDSQSRNWITQIINPRTFHEESDYSGNSKDAAVTHLWALYNVIGKENLKLSKLAEDIKKLLKGAHV